MLGSQNAVWGPQNMAMALIFLACYADEGEEFLKSFVTGGETWILHANLELKEESKQCVQQKDHVYCSLVSERRCSSS